MYVYSDRLRGQISDKKKIQSTDFWKQDYFFCLYNYTSELSQ